MLLGDAKAAQAYCKRHGTFVLPNKGAPASALRIPRGGMVINMKKYRDLSFREKKKIVSGELIKDILGTLFFCFAAALLGVVLVIAFGMRTPAIGYSMTPTLVNSQKVLIDRFVFKLLPPSRFDVVCFYPKGNENSHLYIKRIVGLPGELVEIKDGHVYIDGARLIDDNFGTISDPGLAEAPFLLGEGEYFVLGDNRDNSEDSRNGNIGAVHIDTMVGKAWFKFSCNGNTFGFV